MKPIIIAYIPVLHQGYVQFLSNHPEAERLYLLTKDDTKLFRPLVKDIRALDPEVMVAALKTVVPSLEPTLLTKEAQDLLNASKQPIVTPDDDVVVPHLAELFPENEITTDAIFLRWDKKRSQSRNDVTPQEKISFSQLDQELMGLAQDQAAKSSDWWRQVGAVLVSPTGEVLVADRNRHVPHDYQHYSDGDPRADFQSGEHIEMSSSIHGESQVIAQAAAEGIATKGCSLYVTTFPCPVCAKLVAEAGIKKIYYQDGYSLVDGEQVLKAAGVELIKVENS